MAIRLRPQLLSAVQAFSKGKMSKFDASHDFSHVDRVWSFAQQILTASQVESEEVWSMVCCGSYLHDVLDHKYITDKEERETEKHELTGFLTTQLGTERINVFYDIIDNVSYSKENRGQLAPLSGETLLCRNIVSDADKLDALGAAGARRCLDYARVLEPKADAQELWKHLVQHSDEKLLRLKDQFIRTEAGKQLAIPLHDELVSILQRGYV